MKMKGTCVVVLCLCVLLVCAKEDKEKENEEQKTEDLYTDEYGRNKAVSALDKFFASRSVDTQHLFKFFAESSAIPRDTDTQEQTGTWEYHDEPAAGENVAINEPHTDGEGLKIPMNGKNPWLDWIKGDPNDPEVLFKKQLGFKDVAAPCKEKRNYYYRTYDGSCNWVDQENYQVGMGWKPYQRDTPHGKDYDRVVKSDRKFVPYSRSIDKPNPRSLSTTFFTNATGILINHTPILTGLIEFIIHDVSWSETSASTLDVPIPCHDILNPECEEKFFTFNVTRKERVPGDDIDRTINSATSWVDGSQIYGASAEDNKRLRTGIHGKLKTQKGPDGGDYMAFNPKYGRLNWFDAGDMRVNQDWYVMAIQTLWVRDHNRICDILVKQHPDWNDEQIFLTAREVITCKMFLIALAYMKGYFIMPEMNKLQWIDDNLQLVRLAYGYTYFEVNPLMKFAKFGLDPTGKHPATASDEMSVGYRFHDLIPIDVPLYDENNKKTLTVDFLSTVYTPGEYLKHGIDAVLRGAVQTTLPGFHSGVQPSLRNSPFNLGDPKSKKPFDIAMWSVLRERTRGIPTFNEYFRYWNADPDHLQVKIRTKFSDFTSNPKYVEKLIEFYDTPDDVDLVVGLQLDEELFPGMQIPKSFVLVSLLSLYSLGISDRHGPLFNLVACIQYPNTLQDCRTTSALQDLLWKPNKNLINHGSPNSKLLDMFWFNEIDYEHQGILGLWRLVKQHTNIECIPLNPLFITNTNKKSPDNTPYNPLVCDEAAWKKAWKDTNM